MQYRSAGDMRVSEKRPVRVRVSYRVGRFDAVVEDVLRSASRSFVDRTVTFVFEGTRFERVSSYGDHVEVGLTVPVDQIVEVLS